MKKIYTFSGNFCSEDLSRDVHLPIHRFPNCVWDDDIDSLMKYIRRESVKMTEWSIKNIGYYPSMVVLDGMINTFNIKHNKIESNIWHVFSIHLINLRECGDIYKGKYGVVSFAKMQKLIEKNNLDKKTLKINNRTVAKGKKSR